MIGLRNSLHIYNTYVYIYIHLDVHVKSRKLYTYRDDPVRKVNNKIDYKRQNRGYELFHYGCIHIPIPKSRRL